MVLKEQMYCKSTVKRVRDTGKMTFYRKGSRKADL